MDNTTPPDNERSALAAIRNPPKPSNSSSQSFTPSPRRRLHFSDDDDNHSDRNDDEIDDNENNTTTIRKGRKRRRRLRYNNRISDSKNSDNEMILSSKRKRWSGSENSYLLDRLEQWCEKVLDWEMIVEYLPNHTAQDAESHWNKCASVYSEILAARYHVSEKQVKLLPRQFMERQRRPNGTFSPWRPRRDYEGEFSYCYDKNNNNSPFSSSHFATIAMNRTTNSGELIRRYEAGYMVRLDPNIDRNELLKVMKAVSRHYAIEDWAQNAEEEYADLEKDCSEEEEQTSEQNECQSEEEEDSEKQESKEKEHVTKDAPNKSGEEDEKKDNEGKSKRVAKEHFAWDPRTYSDLEGEENENKNSGGKLKSVDIGQVGENSPTYSDTEDEDWRPSEEEDHLKDEDSGEDPVDGSDMEEEEWKEEYEAEEDEETNDEEIEEYKEEEGKKDVVVPVSSNVEHCAEGSFVPPDALLTKDHGPNTVLPTKDFVGDAHASTVLLQIISHETSHSSSRYISPDSSAAKNVRQDEHAESTQNDYHHEGTASGSLCRAADHDRHSSSIQDYVPGAVPESAHKSAVDGESPSRLLPDELNRRRSSRLRAHRGRMAVAPAEDEEA